jgi:hypothetical protein
MSSLSSFLAAEAVANGSILYTLAILYGGLFRCFARLFRPERIIALQLADSPPPSSSPAGGEVFEVDDRSEPPFARAA